MFVLGRVCCVYSEETEFTTTIKVRTTDGARGLDLGRRPRTNGSRMHRTDRYVH